MNSEEPSPSARRSSLSLPSNVHLGLSVVLAAAAQVFLKLGAVAIGEAGFQTLTSGWVWAGIAALIGSLVSWLYCLRSMPLVRAFNLAAATHALVPAACWLFLGETISWHRGVGILFVLAGVAVSAEPASKLEKNL